LEVLNRYSKEAKASFSKEGIYGETKQPNEVELVLPHLSGGSSSGADRGAGILEVML